MKKIAHILITAAAVSLMSCEYLDVVPKDKATLDDAFKNETNALKFLYSMYGHIPNSVQYWMAGQPCGGDDLATACKGTTRWFCYKSMVYGEESSSVTYHNFMRAAGAPTGGVNYDYYSAIRFCHSFINRIDEVPGISPLNAKEWKGEAYFLLGYYHWLMLEYYGPIVVVDSEVSLNASDEELYEMRSPFDECVNYIVECLDKSMTMLPDKQTDAKWFGRASATAAHAIKTRALLFAASPLFNGNAEFYADFKNPDGRLLTALDYDREKWKRAMDAAAEAIAFAEGAGYRLYENPANATITDVLKRGEKNFHDYFVEPNYNETEYLMAFPNTESYKTVQRLSGIRHSASDISNGFRTSYQVLFPAVEMYYTRNGLPLSVDPLTKDTDLYAFDADAQTAVINLNREPRFYACVGYNRGEFDIDNQTKTINAYAGETHGYIGALLVNEYNNSTGYFFKKPVHKSTSFDVSSNSFTYKLWAYPVVRLAEMYLSYAEADFEYNGSLSAQSLEYLDKVRSRCGLPDFEDSWAIVGGIPTAKEDLRQILHMERNNELMFEGHRYRDMRRWKEAEKCMTGSWKAWNVLGSNKDSYYQIRDFNDFDQRTRVFETPRHYLLPYALGELQINHNLVQNPGW